jgi:hypothetical protein
MVLEVLVFMLSLDCSADFNHDFWTGFDMGMADEWSINATTSCYQISNLPSDIYSYESLADRIIAEEKNNVTSTAEIQPVDFTTYIDRLLSQTTISRQQEEKLQQQVVFLTDYSESVFQRGDANGIAYPTENIAFVRNNYAYSTATLSHEVLHLVLEEEGYPQSCYVDRVHENQFSFSLKEMGDGEYPIVNRFDC